MKRNNWILSFTLFLLLSSIPAMTMAMAMRTATTTMTTTQTKLSAQGIYVNTPTQSQILQFVNSHPILFGTNSKVTYTQVPSIKNPYVAGKVSSTHLIDGLNAANIVRYIAGLPSNLTLDNDFNADAQAASVVNAANRVLDHTPQRPANISDELYGAGYAGASRSNLSEGFPLISETVIAAYMEDGDASNLAVLGHRRWVMNPPMAVTGFGFAPNNFSAMYVNDTSNEEEEKYSVSAWPAQTMPIEYFGKRYPFSVSLGDAFDELDRNNIQVRMVRQSDGKTYNFNYQTTSNVKSQTYFNVDNQNCGQPHCIIWRPDLASYNKGDVFSVEIFGVKKNGENYPISYMVSFFSLKSSGSSNTNEPVTTTPPQISKLTFSLAKLNPKNDTLKISFQSNKEGYVYSKVYDKNNNKVATVSNGAKLKNAGNWWISWTGKDANGNPIPPGSYRIETYLGNGKSFSKALSKNIEILPTNFVKLTNFKFNTDAFDPQSTVLSILFQTDQACTVYCNIYDSNNNKVIRISGGGAVANAGSWSLKWKGVDSSGALVAAGKYRVELYLSNGSSYGNAYQRSVEVY